MDALSVLSRGAKARRTTSTCSYTLSATTAPNPQPPLGPSSKKDLGQNVVDKSSRKRKRSQNEPGSSKVAKHADREQVSSVESSAQRESQEEDRKTEQSEDLGQEARKHILRKHKLKIMEIWSAPQWKENDGRAEAKKRKRTGDPLTGVRSSKKHKKLHVVPKPLNTFEELRSRFKLPQMLCDNMDSQGYTTPTEVQLGSLPLLLEEPLGKGGINNYDNELLASDHSTGQCTNLLTVAPTGSGKTLAFLIPLIARINKRQNTQRGQNMTYRNRAVILAPTKELAKQTVNEARKLVVNTGVSVTLVHKGMSISPKREHPDFVSESLDDHLEGTDLQNSKTTEADILISTPLALLHVFRTNQDSDLALPAVQDLVLDEADVLLDPLFRDQTVKVWSACTRPDLRVTLWSATIGSNIEELAIAEIQKRSSSISQYDEYSSSPPRLLRLVVGLKDSSIPNIQHKLIYSANERGKLMALRQLLHSSLVFSAIGFVLRPPILVFTQTIPRAIALHSELCYDIPGEAGGSSRVAVLHSELSDLKRDSTMARFRKAEIWVLIITDLLARGVDFRGVNGVVNYDLPNSSAAYVHRAGRTGRAGREGGVAVTLYAEDDLPYVKNVVNVIAASEHQGSGGGDAAADGGKSQRWLRDLLPKVAKKDKQLLKRRGVETRRTQKLQGGGGNRVNMKSRISTKSAFDRRVEKKKEGAREASKSRQLEIDDRRGNSEDDELTSFED